MSMICRLLFVVMLGLAASPASAFEVERTGPDPKASVATPKAGVVSPGGVVKPKASEGTNVRIPGLGKIGVLPKLDFGLELLYGENKRVDDPDEAPLKAETDEGDFRIRGSIKHKF
jgi:hypothetical protein